MWTGCHGMAWIPQFIQFIGRNNTCRDETEATGGHLQGTIIKRNHGEVATKHWGHERPISSLMDLMWNLAKLIPTGAGSVFYCQKWSLNVSSLSGPSERKLAVDTQAAPYCAWWIIMEYWPHTSPVIALQISALAETGCIMHFRRKHWVSDHQVPLSSQGSALMTHDVM